MNPTIQCCFCHNQLFLYAIMRRKRLPRELAYIIASKFLLFPGLEPPADPLPDIFISDDLGDVDEFLSFRKTFCNCGKKRAEPNDLDKRHLCKCFSTL